MGYLKNTETYPTKYKKALSYSVQPTKIRLRYVVFRWLHTYELH